MDWTQAITIISVVIAMLGIFFAFIHRNIKSLGNRLDGNAQRIDQLYNMFVDLLKETKK
jgi:hypothetical protein